MREQISIVTGVLGADVHIIGNSILAYALREAGFNVVTLGIFVSQADFIHAVQETAARAILVSSLYGHGEIDCRGFRDKCREAGLHDILMYCGGNLMVGRQDWELVERTFLNMGFDRAYPPGTMPDQVIRDLRADLRI
ncbi:MAG: methylaspartate mutase subunit S [Betaproteobacteria bacterium]|nr:methylaspartate mutase subunit S [Betaproteobacteria bacterium]